MIMSPIANAYMIFSADVWAGQAAIDFLFAWFVFANDNELPG